VAAPRWDSGRVSGSRRLRRRRLGASIALCAIASLAATARAQTGPTAPEAPAAADAKKPAQGAKGSVYPIGALYFQYADVVADVPDLGTLSALTVPLAHGPEGFTAPGKGAGETQPVSLNRPDGTPPEPFSASALRVIDQAIAAEFSRQGIVGVLVRPHPEDIGASTGRDLRPPGVTALRIVVLVNRVVEEHTIASGSRVPENERVDNPAHARILENSPVQPGQRIDKQALDDYVARLNRRPARWVDMAVGPSAEPSGARLDYLVAEGRPYTAYFQASNTGTSDTTKWRERFGFAHHQLTGRDDTLQLDYITGDFSDVNAFFGSYNAPIPFPWWEADRLRGQLDGSWSDYDASQVGIADSHFKGSQWDVGGRLSANVFQYRDLFVDLFSGTHFEHYHASSDVGGFDNGGHSVDFFFPEVGATIERRTDVSRIFGSVSGEFNVPSIAGTRKSDLTENKMGRTDVTATHVNILRWDSAVSFYTVPFFFPVDEPDSSLPASALSNEIFLSFRGQYTEDRLIPAQEAVVGGMDTVRGFPQSYMASDSLFLARAEYRVHLPRLLPIREPFELPGYGSFRLAPNKASGRPDWDLILFGFYDWGRAELNGTVSKDEQDVSTLTGTGLGAELQLPGNLVVRLDYGWTLTQVNGLDKFHDELDFSIALIY
jgi:hypothetical protein